ncbi:MAG: AsmA family protein [Methylocystis sp.]
MTSHSSPPGEQSPLVGSSPSQRPSPKRRRLRAALIGALCLAALATVAAGLAPWTFSKAALIDAISGEIYGSSGLYVAVKGQTTFSLLPRPRIVVEGVALADPSAFAMLEAERLSGDLRLFPLMRGRIEFGRITLARALVTIDLGKSSGAAPLASKPRAAPTARLGDVSLIDATVRLRDGEQIVSLEHLWASLESRGPAAPVTLKGAFDWRGDRMEGFLWIARPEAIPHGDTTPLSLRLDGPPLTIEAEGMAQSDVKPRFVGRLSASAPSLRQAFAMFGLSPPLPGPFDNFKLAATARLEPDSIQLSQLRFSADNNAFEGAADFRREDERLNFQAKLSSGNFSLKPMLAYLPSLSNGDGQWSRETFDLPDLSRADVDLRLSAAHARLARLSVDDAEFSLGLRAGRLEIALDKAKAYKGSLKARATFAPGAEGAVEVHASAQTTGVDAGALLWDAIAREDLGGSLDSNVTLDSSGDSMAALTRELNGRASFTLSQGAIAGVDFERALSRLDKRPLSSAIDIRSGRSSVEKASATIKIADGVAEFEDGQAFGPGFALAFAGSTRVSDRGLALRAHAIEADANGAPRQGAREIGFDLVGSWDEPSLALDAKALIRRSGAAASLLPLPASPEDGAKER